jgi:hypothetical protein
MILQEINKAHPVNEYTKYQYIKSIKYVMNFGPWCSLCDGELVYVKLLRIRRHEAGG